MEVEAKETLADRIRDARQKLLENPDILRIDVAEDFRKADEGSDSNSKAYTRFGCY